VSIVILLLIAFSTSGSGDESNEMMSVFARFDVGSLVLTSAVRFLLFPDMMRRDVT
jgi:hypothetical protein